MCVPNDTGWTEGRGKRHRFQQAFATPAPADCASAALRRAAVRVSCPASAGISAFGKALIPEGPNPRLALLSRGVSAKRLLLFVPKGYAPLCAVSIAVVCRVCQKPITVCAKSADPR
jgi:hypothetical protein